MEPHFPTNCYLRDFLMAAIGTGIGVILMMFFYRALGNAGAFLGLPTLFIFIFIFQGDVRGRYLAASIKFKMEKNNAPNTETK